MFPLYDNIPSLRFPIVTCTIIAINVLVQIYASFLPQEKGLVFAYTYGFIPARVAQLQDHRPIKVKVPVDVPGEKPKLEVPADSGAIIASIFTAMFLHANWTHLLGNMWFLWIFGDNVEDRLGYLGYLVFYIVGGLVANLCHWLSDPASDTVVVGASGAIAAVLGAYVITWPLARIRTLVILVIFITVIDVRAWIVLGFWFLMQVFSAFTESRLNLHGGVALWAHIGGFVAGMIMMSIFGRRQTSAEQMPPDIRILRP